jgi:hypothetical protein
VPAPLEHVIVSELAERSSASTPLDLDLMLR